MSKNVITFTDEQAMLLDTAMDFCAKQSPINLVRARMDDDECLPGQLWQEMVELGWSGINIPEEHGGLGLGMGDLVPVVEAMGRHLLAAPLVNGAIVAQALVLAGSESQQSDWLSRIAGGAVATTALVEESGSWLLAEPECTGTINGDVVSLAGTKCFVLDAGYADAVLVSVMIDQMPRLLLLEKADIPAAAIRREVVIDETRRSFQLSLEGVSVSVERLLPGECLAEIERSAMLLLSAEMAGGHASALNVIVDYLKTRKQFDHYIGSYQSLKHPTVDILIGLEATRSHLYYAAGVIDGDDEAEKDSAVRMLKAVASEGFAFAGDRAIQFHGGFGFTFECDAQLYLRRALWCQHQFGDETWQRACLASLLLDQAS